MRDEAEPTPILQRLSDVLGTHAVPTTLLKTTLTELCHTLEELERLRPGTAAHSVFITGNPPSSGRLQGRPVLAKPLTWADLQAALASLSDDREP